MLRDAISHYHDLLTDELARETQELLSELQQRHHLMFGSRPLCTVLRPRFLPTDHYRFLSERIAVLMRAFNKCHQAALSDDAFRAQFGLTEQEEELFRAVPGFACPMPTSRLDAFFTPEGELRFTEYNAETPAGAAYSDLSAEIFQTLPIMGTFARRYRLLPIPAQQGVLQALLEAFRQWAGRNRKPQIAILDWNEVPTRSEFLLFQEYFHRRGLDCILADPREVEYRQGKLMAGDFHITLIYKRVLISELLARCGMDCAVVRAVREVAVCMVNPFRCKPLYKKASLAVLSDEQNAQLFDAEERQAIEQHIPWTRVVRERPTTYHGATVDLVPFLQANRERLVLKPNDDYGGRGIVLGWTVSPTEWDSAILHALSVPYVAQERVTLPEEPYPALVDGRVHLGNRMFDTAPFVVHGQIVEGCMTRIATDPLLNVTAGGGSHVPTFLIEKR